ARVIVFDCAAAQADSALQVIETGLHRQGPAGEADRAGIDSRAYGHGAGGEAHAALVGEPGSSHRGEAGEGVELHRRAGYGRGQHAVGYRAATADVVAANVGLRGGRTGRGAVTAAAGGDADAADGEGAAAGGIQIDAAVAGHGAAAHRHIRAACLHHVNAASG